MRTDRCFICKEGKSLNEPVVYIAPDKWRHTDCAPGTPKWLNSQEGKKSKVLEYFK